MRPCQCLLRSRLFFLQPRRFTTFLRRVSVLKPPSPVKQGLLLGRSSLLAHLYARTHTHTHACTHACMHVHVNITEHPCVMCKQCIIVNTPPSSLRSERIRPVTGEQRGAAAVVVRQPVPGRKRISRCPPGLVPSSRSSIRMFACAAPSVTGH